MERLYELLNETMNTTLEMASEVGRKVVDWERVNELAEKLNLLNRAYQEERKSLETSLAEWREKEGAKRRTNLVQNENGAPAGAGLSDSADSREASGVSGGDAPVGVALL